MISNFLPHSVVGIIVLPVVARTGARINHEKLVRAGKRERSQLFPQFSSIGCYDGWVDEFWSFLFASIVVSERQLVCTASVWRKGGGVDNMGLHKEWSSHGEPYILFCLR